ncbi:MAG: four helix bundle protein [Candidatus Magasanikbacteria bacterium]|nr:four helix bundle protein [Candidatus Magasanikbacteria bacterium]
MYQFNFNNKNFETIKPPPPRLAGGDIPILTKLNESYKLWHGYFNHLPRHTKFTLGTKIDNLLTECLESALIARYAKKEEKLKCVQQLSAKFDALKFFLKLLWEIGGLNDQKFSALSQLLALIGQMIGRWMGSFEEKPASNDAGNQDAGGGRATRNSD